MFGWFAISGVFAIFGFVGGALVFFSILEFSAFRAESEACHRFSNFAISPVERSKNSNIPKSQGTTQKFEVALFVFFGRPKN